MKVLLILHSKTEPGGFGRLRVNVKTRSLKEKIISLLEEDREGEAFKLLLKKAEVDAYLAPGQKPDIRPVVTLIEGAGTC